MPASDLEQLRDETAAVREWVNKHVAHYSRKRGLASGMPLNTIHRAADSVFVVFQKYYGVFFGAHMDDRIAMTAWQRIFTTPWIELPRRRLVTDS